MKKYLYIATIGIFTLAGCSKEENINVPIHQFSLNAVIEDGTKTTITDDYNILWQSGDAISVGGNTYTTTTAGASATFTGDKQPEKEGETYKAYYPATLKSGTALTLSGSYGFENYADGVVSHLPMYAESASTTLSFKNLCGMLAIKVTPSVISQIMSIRVSSSDKAMSGDFSISDNTAVLTDATDNTKTVSVNYTTAFTPAAGGSVLYVPIPAQDYGRLFIELSENGTSYALSMATKLGQSITIKRNKVYPITFQSNMVSSMILYKTITTDTAL